MSSKLGEIKVRARVPEKQGLKHSIFRRICEGGHKVRARVPEKQGLKHSLPGLTEDQLGVRARVPEKQGLKPYRFHVVPNQNVRPGASSRKTRIETSDHRLSRSLSPVRARVPEKQGLKLHDPLEALHVAFWVRARVPEKQGLKQV